MFASPPLVLHNSALLLHIYFFCIFQLHLRKEGGRDGKRRRRRRRRRGGKSIIREVLHSPGLNSFLIDPPPACVCCEGEGRGKGALVVAPLPSHSKSSQMSKNIRRTTRTGAHHHHLSSSSSSSSPYYSRANERVLSPASRFLNWKGIEEERLERERPLLPIGITRPARWMDRVTPTSSWDVCLASLTSRLLWMLHHVHDRSDQTLPPIRWWITVRLVSLVHCTRDYRNAHTHTPVCVRVCVFILYKPRLKQSI